jgi:hypothetical protein
MKDSRLSKAVRELWGDAAGADEIGFVPWPLIQVALPASSQKALLWEPPANGRLSLKIMSPHGLPYGRIPRLLIVYVTSECVRTGSRTVELGSLSAFFRRLGLAVTGGRNGTIGRVKDQIVRLFTSAIYVEWADRERREVVGPLGISAGIRIWTADTFEGRLLIPSSIELSEAFAEWVRRVPVPVRMRALQALRAPIALDLYMWLAWKAAAVKAPVAVPWGLLHRQVGTEITRERRFREVVLGHLRTIVRLYPDLRIEATPAALVVKPSRPHVARRPGSGRR